MKMTTPVLTAPSEISSALSANMATSGEKVMQFVLNPTEKAPRQAFPKPMNSDVKLKTIDEGKVFAVVCFPGFPLNEEVEMNRNKLIKAVEEKGLNSSGPILLARYNDPGTLPQLRRNELLLEIPQSYTLKY